MNYAYAYICIDFEMQRVRNDKEAREFESTVALSAQLGGNTTFRRMVLTQ